MNVRSMARCALFAALLSICAWLAIPVGDIYVTMQTFGVCLCLGLLGGKLGSVSILIYLLLGAVGLPVFSGFRGGIGMLLDVTGGYLIGFLAIGIVYWLLTALLGDSKKTRLLALSVGLIVCYAFGTVWFWKLYLQGGGSAAVGVILLKCVVPYLIPDGLKLTLAVVLTQRLKQFV